MDDDDDVKVGDRVAVVDEGFGIYEGDQMHPTLGFLNPKIAMDDGRTLWGCECWWGPVKDELARKAS